VVLVALYMLMGFGLNITLGLAGLLDLGFVAFFAMYTVGDEQRRVRLLACPPSCPCRLLAIGSGRRRRGGGAGRPATPTVAAVVGLGTFGPSSAVLRSARSPWLFFAFMFGAFLGLPVLGIRGDYLAIATLGFGEIIAILARSNLLIDVARRPAGRDATSQADHRPADHPLAGPDQIYYIALDLRGVVAFVAYRLRDSRLGRAWLAIREDEDVAEALGINLVQTKLLAYMLGAAFAGLGGALFAAHWSAPSSRASINLFVSINVAAA
jgi:branched-chain amino acid transport system permease protein